MKFRRIMYVIIHRIDRWNATHSHETKVLANEVHKILQGFCPYDDHVDFYKIRLGEEPYIFGDYRFEGCNEGIWIWKKTDINKDPQWKGEDLSKFVPDSDYGFGDIEAILGNQDWLYW